MTLGTQDLRALLDAVAEISEAPDGQAFAERSASVMRGLIGADIASYVEVDLGGPGRDAVDPIDAHPPFDVDIFAAHADDNPLIGHFIDNEDTSPRTWSDFGRRVEDSDLFDLVYRPLGVRHQLGVSLGSSATRLAGLSFDRSSRDFGERERDLLDLARPHLRVARRRALEAEGLRRSAGLLTRGVIVLDRVEGVLECTDLAVGMLGPLGALAAEAEEWLAACRRGSGSPELRHGGVIARYLAGDSQELIVVTGDDSPAWEVRLLGGLVVTGPAGTTRLVGKPGDVVAILACAGGRLAVDEVTDRLWPEAGAVLGRRRLRAVLSRIPRGLLVRCGEVLALSERVVVDIDRFDAEVRSALGSPNRPEIGDRARALYRSGLLVDRPYEEWAAAPRERLRRRYLQLLDALADEADRSGDLERAGLLLAEAIDADPTETSRYLRRADVLAAAGRRASALDVLERARQILVQLGLPAGVELEDAMARARARP